MTTSAPRPLRRRLVTISGVALAVIAEASAVGLLGLSGWFIAACAAAGLGMLIGFSYLEPSGGVRAFAISRIAANYGQRVLQHRAALEQLTDVRLALLGAAVEAPAATPESVTRDGAALDRLIADADVVSRRGIEATTPLIVFAVVGTTAVATLCVFAPASAGVLAAGLVLSAVLAAVGPSHDEGADRTRIRGEIAAAVEAWPELAALGATPLLRNRTAALLARHAATRRGHDRSVSRRQVMIGIVHALSLAGAGVAAVASGMDAPAVGLIMLVAVAVLESAGALADSFAAGRAAKAAGARIASAHDGVPESADAAAHAVLESIPVGGTLFVTGPSGAGKTRLLRRLARSGGAVLVELDDPLFTGNVGGNLRLGAPGLSDDAGRRLLDALGLADVHILARTGVDGREFSGGEAGRLRIARAVASSPALLLIDEPFSGLDAETAASVLIAVRTHLPDAKLVYAVHDLPVGADGAELRLPEEASSRESAPAITGG